MRLLLDEHFSPRVAEQLRKRGCDVVGAIERAELLGLSDEELLRWASKDARAVVTENVRDFLPIHGWFLNHGEQHCGLILTSPRKYPRTEDGFGNVVTALAKLLADRPGSSSLRSDVLWL